MRFETALDSRCEPVGIGREKHWSARIEDISVSGLRLILPRRFEPGTVLAVEIKSPDKKSQSIQVVKVMRVCRDKPRQWLLGCSFLRPLNAAELRAIL